LKSIFIVGKRNVEEVPMKLSLASPRACGLICEAIEYYVLNELSMHLTGYFNDKKFKKENLKEFERNDVPEVLLRNRFMELFSKPMEERPHFVDQSFEKKAYGETVLAFSGGALFEKFQLVLPERSIVRRLEENKIQIETARFFIDIVVDFKGINTYVSRSFEEYYLSLGNWQDINAFMIHVDIQVSFKFGRLLSRTGWEYYQWVDSFLEKMDKSLSKDTFFKTIGWNLAVTVIDCMKNLFMVKEK
jgi:hypothetical protein